MEHDPRANLGPTAGGGRGAFLLALALCLFPQAALAQEPADDSDEPDAAVASGDLAAELPATEERIEALQKLAAGEHPGVPLDTLLNVSLDDDSSMMERDRAVRLARRKVLIASRVGERFGNRSEEEMAHMRNQLLAMDLERKVLALPIEVRSRLVDLDAERGGAPTAEPGSSAGEQNKAPSAEAEKPANAPKSTPQTHVNEATTEATDASSGRALPEDLGRQRITWRSWLTFLGFLLGIWVLVQVASMALVRLGSRIPARRGQFEQLASFIRLPLYGVGLLLSLALAFPLAPELMFILFGTLALSLALACKDLIASSVAGFIVVLTRPFQVGDRIAIGDVQGKVTEIGLSETRLLTAQNRLVIIPNNVLLTKWVSAVQAGGAMTPLQLDFFVDASQDISAAKRIVEETIQNTRSVDMPKGQTMLVKQLLTDRGLTVRLRTKVFVMGSQSQDEVESELTERVLEAFRTGGIRAAQPQAASARG